MERALLAARQPLALAVLVAAIFSGLTVALWLLPVGLIVYGALVLALAQDPRLALQTGVPLRPRALPADFKQQIDVIERANRDIERLVADSSAALQRLLRPIAEQARALLAQAYELADKGCVIDSYTAQAQPEQIKQQLASVEGRLKQTEDDYTRRQLEETRAALTEQLENMNALHTYRERVVAQLTNLAANLNKVYTDTLRLRAAEATDVTSASGQIAEQLSNLNADVNAFQHVLEGALGRV